MRLQADKREEVEKVFAGEIAARGRFEGMKTSQTVCDEANPIVLEQIKFPEPVVSIRIEPKTKADQEKMGSCSAQTLRRRPDLPRLSPIAETGGDHYFRHGRIAFGDLVERMKREFSVVADVGKPQVAYRETILKGRADAEGKYIKQTGGRGQYGHVKIKMKRLEPIVEGAKISRTSTREDHFEFINNIKGGVIPQEYIPAVEKGLREAMSRGFLAGFPMVDISVDLYDGSYHDVDSSEIAFKIAASMAFQEAAGKAKAVILEPIMRVEVIVPEQFMGDITGNLSGKRGQIEGMEERGMNKVVKAKVPLSEMFGYTTTLRSMTEGRGSMTMEFDHYDTVPNNIATDIIASRK